MATSTIPDVKAALVSLIGAALPGVMVTWGEPRGQKDREWILVGKVTTAQDAAALGRQRRQEDYTVEIQVTVVYPSVETPQATTERAFELVAEIEDVCRADETLGGVTNLIWARVEKTDLTEGFINDDERMTEVIVHIGCKSRI